MTPRIIPPSRSPNYFAWQRAWVGGGAPSFQPMGMLISRSSVITSPFPFSFILFFFFKGHNRVFLIRTGARPIDADASLQELGGGRENKRKYSKERARGWRRNSSLVRLEVSFVSSYRSHDQNTFVTRLYFPKKLENKETRKFTLN